MRIDQEPPPDAPTPDALEASGLPLYRSLGRSLLRRIRSGEWQPGQQIPSERELMALTGLSRDTVRKGLDDLVRQGVLDRVQGRGTFVAARGPGPRLADLAGIWRGAGRQVELLLTDCGSGDVPEDVRQVLALSALERIIWIQHLLTLDGTPAAVQHAYLPQALFPTLLKQCAAGQDLAAAVSSTEGAGIVFYAESLEPTALGSLEAYLLGLRAGLPALLLEHLGLDARGRRVLFQSSTLRGDLCRAYVADALGAWNLREAEAAPPHFAAALRDAEHALRERHAPQPVRAAAGVAARPAAARPWPTPALPERANAPRRSVYSVAPAPAVPADQAALSRRQFLRMTSLVAASSLAAVCPPVAAASAPAGKAPAQAPAAAAPGEPATTLERRPLVFREAPLLAERVAAGLLPPVEQRLPRIPSLYPVAETIGRYGGTIRRAVAGRSDFGGASKWVATSLTHFNPDLSLRPDLCEAWEVNDEATTYTVHLRDGLCWSDGQPFTSEDVRWWYEEVIRDKDLSQGAARGYTTGEPPVLMSLEVPDDLTVVIRFAHPFPVFMHQQNSAEPFLPSHYMRQFHARFVEDPDALQRRAEEAGLPSWTAYFWERDKWYMNPARPVLYPWMATNRLDSDLFVLERNPFFCGIDAAGQQLPYVDRVTFRQFDSLDVFNMWVLNGEIDLQGRHVDIGAYDLFREGQARGGYRVDLWQADDGDTLGPNHDCQDARLRAFFGQREVRKALSLAIDREEINKQVYNGMGTPRQASPTSQGPYYHEPAARAYASYAPKEANRLLDAAGYAARDAAGWRVWDDGSGEPISFVMESWARPGEARARAAEMVIRYYKAIGIRALLRLEDRAVYEARSEANEIQAAWQGGGHYTQVFLKRDNYYTGEKTSRAWAGGWGLWKFNHGDPNGHPPPAGHWLWEIWDIWDAASTDPDEARRIAAHRRIMDIWAREVPVIGVVGELPGPVIVKNGIRNFTGSYPFQTPTNDDALLGSPVYFWDDPDAHR